MKIPVSILKAQYHIETGNVYYGSLAKDGSNHAAVIICVTDEKVFCICLTSQKDTIQYYSTIDEFAVVKLTNEERALYFPTSDKPTWIYCGKAGLCEHYLDDFFELLAQKKIIVRAKAPTGLVSKVVIAIHQSVTFSDIEKETLGV